MSPHNLWLLIAALSAVVVLVLLISTAKLHPFISILVVSLALGLAVGMPAATTIHSFETGVGNTLGHIAVVVVLGTILGKMMAESGGAEQIANTLIRFFGESNVHWAMLLIGLITGLPVFFEVGFFLLIPIAFNVAHRTGKSLVLITLPMLAGLSIVHAFIPPHPAAMAAVTIFQANIGRTILYALIVGIPAAVLAGPVYAQWIAPRITLPAHNAIADQFVEHEPRTRLPSFALTLATIFLPVILMLIGPWADHFSTPGTHFNATLRFIGGPDGALLIGVLVSFITFGFMQGFTREQMLHFATTSLPPTAGALLLIGAGGGFGRILQDTNISAAIVEAAEHAHLSIILLAWLVAALIRVATGSSTVAMTTAAGIIAPIALHTPGVRPELLVIAVGAGSIVLSHVNDGGFWLVKEYLGLSVTDTFKTWTALETILSITGLALALLLSAI
jgi:GntP family gluconate:H+ symporter